MTRPNREEIERMLSAGDPPKPPSDLLERLHADIPVGLSYGRMEQERPVLRLWRSGWVAAASILAVVSMSYVMLRVLDTPEYHKEVSVAQQSPSAASQAPMVETAPTEEKSFEEVQELDAAAPAPAPALSRELAKDAARQQEADGEFQSRARMAAPMATPALVVPYASESRDEAVRRDDLLETTEFSPQPAAPTPVPASANQAERRPQEGAVGGIARGMEGKSITAVPAPAPALAVQDSRATATARLVPARGSSGGQFIDAEADPVSSFGLRVGDSSWALVRSSLLDGRLPPRSAVRTEELINHFGFPDPEPSSGEVTVRTEGAEAPARTDEAEHLLRVGVRVSPSEEVLVRGAKMQVEFDPAAVDSYRLIGFEHAGRGSSAATRGEDLPPGQRTTALYEVRIHPETASSAQVGVVRLQYETAGAGKKQIEQVVRRGDVAHSWASTSRDLQLAALVADWADVLQRDASNAEMQALDRRAGTVAGRWRGDAKVAELVELIRTTARLMQ